MTAIVFEATALLSDAAPGVAPGTTKAIPNSFDGEGSDALALVFAPTGGTNPTAEIDLYIWDGTQYQRTGDTVILDPAGDNYFEFPGGVYLAVGPATITGAPLPWEIRIGRRPSGG